MGNIERRQRASEPWIREVDPLPEAGRIVDCLGEGIGREERQIRRLTLQCYLGSVVIRIGDISGEAVVLAEDEALVLLAVVVAEMVARPVD